jgi:hypothetical protein
LGKEAVSKDRERRGITVLQTQNKDKKAEFASVGGL